MTDIPTDAFNKWHPDKASAFPAQAVDVIHYLQDALAQCRIALQSQEKKKI